MTEQEYRQHPAVSRSELFRILDSPEKFRYFKDNPEPPTPALLFGPLFHAMVLQPKEAWKQCVVAPKVDRRKKEDQAVWEQFLVDSNEKTVVPMDMVEQAGKMCKALREYPIPEVRRDIELLLSGEKEKEFFWTDDMTGEQCKCRVDCLSDVTVNGSSVVVDVKSAAKADYDSFIRDAIKYGYDFQAAWYTNGVTICTGRPCIFVFIVVEKPPPYAVNIFQADPILLRRGGDLVQEEDVDHIFAFIHLENLRLQPHR